VSGAFPVVEIHERIARGYQGTGVSGASGQRAHQSLQLQVFEFASAAGAFVALDAFESVEDQDMRRVAGKCHLQALQHSTGGRVLFAGEVEVGGAQEGVGMGIFVEGPDEDAGAV
jgi:hypothetical protein